MMRPNGVPKFGRRLARAKINFNNPGLNMMIRTTTTSTTSTTSTLLSSGQHPDHLGRSQFTRYPHLSCTLTTVPPVSNFTGAPRPGLSTTKSTPLLENCDKDNVFTTPFWELNHCSHCYPESGLGPRLSSRNPTDTSTSTATLTELDQANLSSTQTVFEPSRARAESPFSGNGTPLRSPLITTINFPTGSLLHSHQTIGHHANMSTSTNTPAPTTTATTPKPKPTPRPGQGILVPASKVHTTIKSELLSTLSQAEFDPDGVRSAGSNRDPDFPVTQAGKEAGERKGRGVKLVGILATGMEDAANYAEVSHPYFPHDRSLTSALLVHT
jgi:hypothetical protein